MRDPTQEDYVQTIVNLLRDKNEAEREKYLQSLRLSPDEKDSIQQHLWKETTIETIAREELRKDTTFQRLVQEVRRGRAVLFVGAGVSYDAGMPSSSSLTDALKRLAEQYGVPLVPDQSYTLDSIADLLDRAGLRRRMIETLQDRVRTAASSEKQPVKKGFYRLLPYLAELNKLILTTNWDELIERALDNAGEPAVVIRRDWELPLVSAAAHAVLKLHGDFTDSETLVVSGSDYAIVNSAISRAGGLAGTLWGAMAALLAQKSVIFVGYQLADKDMNLLRTLVSAPQINAAERHYMVGPFSEADAKGLRDWANMEVIQATAGEFFVALAKELAEFANRRDDLDRIFRKEAADFMEFYAPFGAGKHALLDEVERRALDSGWKPEHIVRIDLRSSSTGNAPPTTPELIKSTAGAMRKPWIDQGEVLRKTLEGMDRLLIVFEHTEVMEQDWPTLVRFVNDIPAEAVRSHIEKEKRSRLILSGRSPVEGWPFAFRKTAEIFPLASFSLAGVREMVGKYTLFNDPKAEIDPPSPKLVEDIYDLTGRSNPRFIKEILDDLMKESSSDKKFRLPSELAENRKKKYINSFLETIRQEVWLVAPQGLETLFARGLCALRKLNASLLQKLASDDLLYESFSQVGSPQEVIAMLKRSHLLASGYSCYVIDPIVRRIHSRALDFSEEETGYLVELHQVASNAWASLLSTTADTVQIEFFQEWLYHEANRLLLGSSTEEKRWQELQNSIGNATFRTTQMPPAGMGQTLLQAIEDKPQRDRDRDGELLDVLRKAIGEKNYEDLRKLLIDKKEVMA